MPSDIEALIGLEHQEFMGIMGQYLYESIGAQEFARRHMLTQNACVIVPSTAHISLTKAVTLLGLGRESLVTVAVDEDARMDSKGLNMLYIIYHALVICPLLHRRVCMMYLVNPSYFRKSETLANWKDRANLKIMVCFSSSLVWDRV